jgi:hypothetical protein
MVPQWLTINREAEMLLVRHFQGMRFDASRHLQSYQYCVFEFKRLLRSAGIASNQVDRSM